MIDLETEALKSLTAHASASPAGALELLDQSTIRVDDFAKPHTRALFAALVASIRADTPPDPVRILHVIGSSVPRDWALEVLTSGGIGHARQQLALVRDLGSRRSAVVALRVLISSFENQGISTVDSTTQAQRLLSELMPPTTGARNAAEDAMALIDKLERVQRGEKTQVVPTGIEALDFAIGGLQRTLTVIGARPRVGKSALLATIASNICARGEKVGLVSLEDQASWIVRRIFAAQANVSLFRLATKPLHAGEMDRINEAGPGIYSRLNNLVVDDSPGMNSAQVVATVRRMVSMGCKAIMIDHLGQIRLERSDRHDLDIADALADLRDIAKTYGVPMVVATHLRRTQADDNDVPGIQDFAFSAGVERMARVALGLFGDPSNDRMGVALLKQTEGPSGFAFTLNRIKTAGLIDSRSPIEEKLRKDVGE